MITMKKTFVLRVLMISLCMIFAISSFCLTAFASEAETDAKEDEKSVAGNPNYSYTFSTTETDENGKVIFVGTIGGSAEANSDEEFIYLMNGVTADQLGVLVQGQVSTVEKDRTPVMIYVLGGLCIVCFVVIAVLVYMLRRRKGVRVLHVGELVWESKSKHS